MLILVAVTVNLANENGGLFEKARYAKSETAAKAEEEELTMYMFGEGVYNAKTGKVDLDALGNLLTDETKWKNVGKNGDKLVVTGTESGKGYIIDEKGTISEQKDGEDQLSKGILGTYYALGDISFSGSPTLELKTDNQAIVTWYFNEGDDILSTGSYTYDETTKTGTIVLSDYGSDGDTFTFNIINLNNNLVIEMIGHNGDYQWADSVWAKEKYEGFTKLGTRTYVNGTKTIEFGTSVEDGVEMGTGVIKENGAVLNSMEGYYLCYNGKIILSEEVLLISDDQSTITYDGEVFTKQ